MTGLLVLHKGEIVFEQYQQGVRPTDTVLPASMSKSILVLLVAILPEFANSAFANKTVEELLRMTAGVSLVNSYARAASTDNQATNPAILPTQDVSRSLQAKRTPNPAGKVFNYNGAVSAMLGFVLSARTGQTHTQYLQEKIWTSMGAADPADWIKNRKGEEEVQGQFAVTLRDYVRLGLLTSQLGRSGVFQIAPEAWIAEMVASRFGKPQRNGPNRDCSHRSQSGAGRQRRRGL